MVLRRTIPAGRSGVALVATFAVLLTSCGPGWRRPNWLAPVISPRQQVQVWSGDTARRWRAVRVGPDSISGIPFDQPNSCPRCRRAVPNAAVDSVRFGDPVAGFWKSVGLVFGATMLALVYTCRAGCIEN